MKGTKKAADTKRTKSCLNCRDFGGIVKRRRDGVEVKCTGHLQGPSLFLSKLDDEPRCSKWKRAKEASK